MTGDNMKNSPNYSPNSFANTYENPEHILPKELVTPSDIYRYESKHEDNYSQVRDLYLSYSEDERERLYQNIASELSKTYEFIKERAYDMFSRVHIEYGKGVRKAVLSNP